MSSAKWRPFCLDFNVLIPFLQVSLADLKAFDVSDMLIRHEAADILEQTPLLKAHYDRMSALPNIAPWIKKRPETER